LTIYSLYLVVHNGMTMKIEMYLEIISSS